MTVYAGEGVVLQGDEWYRVQIAIDRTSAMVHVFVDGTFAFSASNETLLGMVGTSATPMTFTADSLYFENPRLVDRYSDHFGFVELDNLTVTSKTVPVKNQSFSESFDGYVGKEPADAFASLGVSGSTVTDAYGSPAWMIPLEGNAGKTPVFHSPSYTYLGNTTVLLEADYFFASGANGSLEALFTEYFSKRDGVTVMTDGTPDIVGTDLSLYSIGRRKRCADADAE